ncbi:MAG TPA: sensor domain-containing diguanylate cyclase [Rectinemataceae bacterium]|nr:sensor domain-containing diguanylate cyclase [Rectinemataceae bacterium]
MKEMSLEPMQIGIGVLISLVVLAGVYRALRRRNIRELSAWNLGNLAVLVLFALGAVARFFPSLPLLFLLDALGIVVLCCYASASLRLFGEKPPRLAWSIMAALILGASGALSFSSGNVGFWLAGVSIVGSIMLLYAAIVVLTNRNQSGIKNGPGLLVFVFGIVSCLLLLRAAGSLSGLALNPGFASNFESGDFVLEISLATFLGSNFSLILILMTRLENRLVRRMDEGTKGKSELQFLYDVFAGTAGIVDPVELFHRVLDLVQTRLKAVIVVIYLEDHEGEGLTMAAQRGLDAQCVALLTCPDPERSVAGQVFSRKEPLAIPIADYENQALREALAAIDIGIVGAFPLSAAGGVIGVLSVGYHQVEELDNVSYTLLETLSLQLGAVIRTAILHAKLDRANTRLSELASTDVLTNLANRRAALQALDRELARAKRASGLVAVIMGDLDHFKGFNDRFGHDCGDYVLSNTASIIADTVRGTDIPSRWGGEEFLIVLGESEPSGAYRLAERLRERIESAAWSYGGRKLKVTITLGVALAPPSVGPEAIIAFADEALYRGKRGGRNQVTMILDDGSSVVRSEIPLLEEALAEGDEAIEVLPIVDEVV